MVSFSDIIFYILIFLSVYIQVFFLVTFLENKHKFVIRKEGLQLATYPLVTIIIPCWNEEETVARTVASVLGLNYPQNKIKLVIFKNSHQLLIMADVAPKIILPV